jgi:hypothetical protein
VVAVERLPEHRLYTSQEPALDRQLGKARPEVSEVLSRADRGHRLGGVALERARSEHFARRGGEPRELRRGRAARAPLDGARPPHGEGFVL